MYVEITNKLHLFVNSSLKTSCLPNERITSPPMIIISVVYIFSGLGSTNVDSARANLSSSFVNGFVNCGFGQDKLLMEDGNKWLYKNKEHGMNSEAIVK